MHSSRKPAFTSGVPRKTSRCFRSAWQRTPSRCAASRLQRMPSRPRILVTNDDGIKAPGIVALVKELCAAATFDVTVCAPSSERSAQSHAITLGRYMSAFPSESMQNACKDVTEAWAVDGTPADSIMLALHSPCLKSTKYDLVVSGINRGDNCGLHIIYSGTVAGAREAACKGLPGMAFSLDNHQARRVEDYSVAAKLSLSLVKAYFGMLPGQESKELTELKGCVLNVNIPVIGPQVIQGYYLTHQSTTCVYPAFKEIQEPSGAHLPEIDEHTPNTRVFRNYAGEVNEDDTEGGDGWAVKAGYVSVTPLGLRSCVPSRHYPSLFGAVNSEVIKATGSIVIAAAADMALNAGGVSKL